MSDGGFENDTEERAAVGRLAADLMSYGVTYAYGLDVDLSAKYEAAERELVFTTEEGDTSHSCRYTIEGDLTSKFHKWAVEGLVHRVCEDIHAQRAGDSP